MLTSSKLQDICLLVTDGTHDSPKLQEAGVPFIKGKHISSGYIDFENCDFVSPEDHEELKRRVLPRLHDVLFANIGSVGDTARVKTRTEFSIKNMALFRPDPQKIDVGYFYYLVSSKPFRESILTLRSGSAQPFITLGNLRNFAVKLHSDKTHQHRIASILTAYDDLIENNTRRIAILEEIARRIYEEWFVRFRFPGHEQVKMVESELGLIPEGWAVKRLEDLAVITMGLSPKGDSYNDAGTGIPLINGPVEFGERLTKRVKWTSTPTKLCKDGDLIVCVRGSTTGKYVKSDGEYCLGRGVCSISSEFQSFVDQLFTHQLPTLLGQTGGSTFPSWTGPQLKNHPTLAPPRVLLERFEMLASPMRKATFVYSRQIDNLRTTRDLLLPKLISGELDVSTLPAPEEAIAA